MKKIKVSGNIIGKVIVISIILCISYILRKVVIANSHSEYRDYINIGIVIIGLIISYDYGTKAEFIQLNKGKVAFIRASMYGSKVTNIEIMENERFNVVKIGKDNLLVVGEGSEKIVYVNSNESYIRKLCDELNVQLIYSKGKS